MVQVVNKLDKQYVLHINRLIRSKRKTVSLEITNHLELVVRAPYRLPLSEVQKIIQKKSDWINKTRERLKNQESIPIKKKSFKEGNVFYLKGEKYKLSSILNGKKRIDLIANKIILYKMPHDNSKDIFINWYKEIAKKIITKRVNFYSKSTGLYPKSIKITSAKKRWGSCSGKNSINFSYRLIMAPDRIIDYVIVHELIHIEEKNHSRNFWKKVENFIPDYKEKRKWLKNNGHIFEI